MNEIFKLRKTSRVVRSSYKLNLDVTINNQVSFGGKSLRYYGPRIWNLFPFHVKSSENLKAFKNIIKNWSVACCKCRCVNVIKYQLIIFSYEKPVIEPAASE